MSKKILLLLMVALLLLCSLLAQLLPQTPPLAPTWSYPLAQDPYRVLARPQGGAVVTMSDKIIWLTDGGTLEFEKSVAPDLLHFPEDINGVIYSGTEAGRVLAFSVGTGELLWETEVSSTTCKVIAGESNELWALLGSVQEGYREVVVLNSQGHEQRRFKLAGKTSGMFPMVSPTGLLIADTTIHNAAYDNARLTAFDTRGKQRWSNQLGGFMVWDLMPGPQETFYGVAHQKKVFCLDAKTGREKWSFSNPRQPSGTPWSWHHIWRVPREQLLVESEGWLYLLNSGGQLVWERELGAPEPSCVVGPNGQLWAVVSTSTEPSRWLAFRMYLKSLLGGSQDVEVNASQSLVSYSPDGERKHRGPLGGAVNLDAVGPEGELYGWGLDHERSGFSVRRYDP